MKSLEISMNVKKTTFQIIIIDLLFLIGALQSSMIVRSIAALFFIGFILSDNVYDGVSLLIGMSANQAILVLTSDGLSLVGVGYLLIAFKIVMVYHGKICISKKIIRSFLVLLSIGIILIVKYGSFYDLAISFEVFLTLFVLILFTRDATFENKNDIISYYILGSFLCAINLLVPYVIYGYSGERVSGVMDNANYTAVSFVFSAICCLILYCYKKNTSLNLFLFFFFVLMLLLTGSRGALLALIVAIIWILFSGFSRMGRVRNMLLILVVGLIVLYISYSMGVSVIVNIYDNVIGRTIERLSETNRGKYMDISSGRITLWEYYINVFKNESLNCKLFGNGNNRYYLKEYGGFGQLSHNILLGSLMGIGVIGTIATLIMYGHFYKGIVYIKTKKHKTNLVCALWITFVVAYLFVDGIFDLRIIVYIYVAAIVKLIITQATILEN